MTATQRITGRHSISVDEIDRDHRADIDDGAFVHTHAAPDVDDATPSTRADAQRGPYRVTVLLVVLSAVGILTTGLVAVFVP